MTHHPKSPHFRAAAHLIENSCLRDFAGGCVNHDRGVIDWDQLETTLLSEGERLVFMAALDIWNGSGGVQLLDLVRRARTHDVRVVLNALHILRDGLVL